MKYYDPDIPSSNYVQIIDMNFLANPDALDIIRLLGTFGYNGKRIEWELVCGVDFRLLTQEVCDALKESNFVKMRWAWDYSFNYQKKHQKIWRMFKKAGYKSRDLRVFMLVNWKIPYVDCCRKLDLLKIWGVEVADCCWDGGYKIAKPVYWKPEHIKKFRAMCRKHDQMIIHELDPEYLK